MRWDVYVLELVRLAATKEIEVLVREHEDVSVGMVDWHFVIAWDSQGVEVERLEAWDDFPVKLYEERIEITGSIVPREAALDTGFATWYLHQVGRIKGEE